MAEELISLDDPTSTGAPLEPSISLDEQGPKLGLDAATRRANDSHVALGDNSPGVDALKTRYLSGEGDKDIRTMRASQEALANARMRQEAIKEMATKPIKSPDDPYIAAHIAGQKDEQDPDTIIEKGFADSVISIGTRVFGGVSKIVQQVTGTDDGIDMTNATRDAIAKRKVTQNLLEEDKANQDATSTLQKTYEVLEGFVPGVSWYRIEKAAKDIPAGVALPGQTLWDIVNHAQSLPPNEYFKYVYQVYDQLKQGSQTDASRFAAALESYSRSDAAFDSAMEVLNIGTAVPVASISKGFRGAVKALTEGAGRGVASIADKALQQSSTGSAKGFLKQLFRTVDSPVVDAGRAAAQLGDTATAARINVTKEALGGFKDIDPRTNPDYLRSRMPTLFNPSRLIATRMDDGSALAAPITQRILDNVKKNADSIFKALDDVKVQRAPEEAIQIAIRQAEDAVRRDYTHLNNAVLDIVHVTRPEEAANNVGSVSIYLGKTTGETFENRALAEMYADNFYGITGGDRNIEQVGGGWAIRVARDFDETTPEFRKAAVSIPTNQTPVRMKDIFLGWFRSGEDAISPFQSQQRHLAQHASVRLHQLAKAVAEDIGSLKNAEKKDLSLVLEANRSWVSEDGKVRGRFNQTLNELEMEYEYIHGRLPSEQEAKAYFAYVALNDLDYSIRNMALYKEKSRLGIKEFQLFKGTQRAPFFEGRELSEFPKGMDTDAGLWVHTNASEVIPGEFRRLKVLDAADRAEVEGMLKDGFKLIQVANPSDLPLQGITGTDKPVHFVLAKSVHAEQLNPTQIPYRPGGHKDYAVQHFVKQPIVRRIADGWEPGQENAVARTTHSYEGEKAAFGFHTEAEARKYTNAMEQARKLLKEGKDAELAAHLEKSLPYDVKSFKALFNSTWEQLPNGQHVIREAQFNVNDPFVYLKSGRRFTDDYGTMTSQWSNFEDNIRNPYNLYDQIDKKFAGERDPDLFTVRESGTEARPTFHIDSADQVDPLVSVSNSMANIMRNRYMTDVKISAVDSWISEFGDLIKGTASIEEVRANPLAYIYKDTWDTSSPDRARLAAAKNSRRALLNFLGEEAPLGREVNFVIEKIANSVYNFAGQKWGSWAAVHLPTETDPGRFARKFAFTLTMGMFNPVQLFTQANSMTHVIGVAGPKNGFLGAAVFPMTRALLINDKPQMLEHFASMASKFGWKKENFIESMEGLKKSGWHLVEGEAAWGEDYLTPKLVPNKFGAFFDKSTIFFKEGERIPRISAWHASYLEWKEANPGKVLADKDIAQIVTRADLMTVNMTRASNAAWNTGVLSIPTQFGSYSARLMEQFLGKRLTGAEKARLFATYSTMYGVPVAFTGVVPVADWYNDIRTEFLNRGINPDGGAVGLVMNGIPTTMMHAITGRDYNINDRFGPGQFPILKTLIEDKPSLDMLLGPSGSIIKQTYANSQPLMYGLLSPFRSEETQYAPTSQDVIKALQSVSTINYGTRTLAAMNLGTWMTKNGVKITSDVDTFDALFTGITGTSPRKVTDTFLKMKNMKDLKELQSEAERQIGVSYKQAIQAINNKDESTYKSAMAQTRLWLQMGQFRPDQYGQLIQKVLGPNLDLAQQTDMKWFLEGPAKWHQERVKAFTGQNN